MKDFVRRRWKGERYENSLAMTIKAERQMESEKNRLEQ